ncbi:DUF3298 domain-containing protein [Pontibacter sp. G13]|uniref:DUF3298 and DUF4163 domain-containing protein n=1 Tax=Pontibacter sp. G13 TaxID=3074898 RepID=UPI00288B1377|nr:DUF3298 domain-containing protein [Pontibacter sp. G13]WNJ20602.1 DUF3298 domain-containing protein [Pontibacter sp. G13]
MAFERVNVERIVGNCSAETGPCATVSVQAPVVEMASHDAKIRVNSYIVNQVKETFASVANVDVEPIIQQSAQELADSFFAHYEAFTQEFPDSPQRWSVDIKGDVLGNAYSVVTYKMHRETYTGGAHPNHETHYATFNAANGKKLKIGEIVRDTANLNNIAEPYFREAVDIAKDLPLMESGFSFDQNKFQVPNNFGMVQEGIIFHYNPYEIAPYAAGEISFLVPYDALGGAKGIKVTRKKVKTN